MTSVKAFRQIRTIQKLQRIILNKLRKIKLFKNLIGLMELKAFAIEGCS